MFVGVVALLVVLAIVGLVVTRQLKATRQGGLAAVPAAASGASAPATVADQSRQVQKQVQADLANSLEKALDQGAARKDDADPVKP